MKAYPEMTRDELVSELVSLKAEFEQVKARGLKLDMSRGKPSKAQLDLSNDMMDVLTAEDGYLDVNGTDIRNYGGLDGIPEAKKLMADFSGNRAEDMIVLGNSSLNIMFDSICRSFTHGVMGNTPWCRQEGLKWLCPAPGYDRHFRITQYFGFELITVPMTPDGPDMDAVEEAVKDPSVKGIWCVPKYSNPQGYTYSDETVRRFADLEPAAADFRIYWDNAYAEHHLYEEPDRQDQVLNILDECRKAGHPDLAYQFCSTSKVTWPGAGIAAIAASADNLADIRKHMQNQTIGPDKVNQLRHVRYFGDIDGVRAHMKKHAELLRPKFEAVTAGFEKSLGGLGIGKWTSPRGGYFISFDALPGCAKAIVEKAAEAGVKLTGAGATYPYGNDPADSNIRIAPSFPTPEEMAEATEVFTLSVRLVSAEKLLAEF